MPYSLHHRKQMRAEWRRNNRDRWNAISTKSRQKNIEKIRERDRKRGKIRYQKHREQINARHRALYHSKSPEERREASRRNAQKQRQKIQFRIRLRLSTRILAALRGYCKSRSTVQLLGCSVESFKKYIESKFEPGMSWNNYGRGKGKFHLDHIVPCALFDLTKKEHQEYCFHYSNYQPMWETDNRRKSAKLEQPVQGNLTFKSNR